ncbi:hypothetical protein [Nitrosovibrio sp. Nv17]|uniref:hypothetical protein n=1 Tax=Nitrosovibrio sp. Nv17 TaxID=1855339 RepID=UPI0009088BEA|nr:hypothetical protein [Nitrosovibrio sp. Nv17]SFW25170.1 hypothetical protein SAMN05216414_10888 [Nitrosovibrio sp. Nv17]
MDKPRSNPSSHRLQELLAIPERQRTEAQWDELNELEITLTPVNRAGSPEPGSRRVVTAPSDPSRTRSGVPGKRPVRKLRKRAAKGGESRNGSY